MWNDYEFFKQLALTLKSDAAIALQNHQLWGRLSWNDRKVWTLCFSNLNICKLSARFIAVHEVQRIPKKPVGLLQTYIKYPVFSKTVSTNLWFINQRENGRWLKWCTVSMKDRKKMQTAVVWSCFPFIRSGQNHLARHSARGKKTRQTKEEVERQHQGMDRPGVRQVPEGSGEQGKMEKTGCKIICGAPTTLAVKKLMMMMILGYGCTELLCTQNRHLVEAYE